MFFGLQRQQRFTEDKPLTAEEQKALNDMRQQGNIEADERLREHRRLDAQHGTHLYNLAGAMI